MPKRTDTAYVRPDPVSPRKGPHMPKGKITVVNNEQYREDHAAEIEGWSKQEKLAQEMRGISTIDMERNDEDEAVQLGDFTRHAKAGLAAILAQAALEEAKAKSRG